MNSKSDGIKDSAEPGRRAEESARKIEQNQDNTRHMSHQEMQLVSQELQKTIDDPEVTALRDEEERALCRNTLEPVSWNNKTKEALIDSENKYRSLFSAMNDGACLYEIVYDYSGNPVDYRILEVNPRFEEITGLEEHAVLGRLASQVYGTGAPPFMDIYSDVALSGSQRTFETYFEPMKKYFRISVYPPLRDRFITVFQDITRRRRAEEKLKESETRYRTILKAIPDIMFIYSLEGIHLDYHATDDSLLFTKPEQFLGRSVHEILPAAVADLFFQNFTQAIKKKKLVLIEYPLKVQGGLKHFEARISPMDDQRVLAIIRDITERKKAEQDLRASLEEKEILLREVHHRVKKNLAIISALLEMQHEQIKDHVAKAVLVDLETRIRSIALVHESLYKNENLAWIDFHDYLDSLVQDLRYSLGAGKDILYLAEAQDANLEIDVAIPCGMIINELVSNAIKYAFPDGRTYDGKNSPWISVEVQKDDGHYRIIVADNGVGFPEALNLNNSASFGLRLVRMIGTHQLGGKFELERSPGTRITFTFKTGNRERT